MPDGQATAMLDCEDGDKEGNSNCKHCQASGDNQRRYWDIQLDQDLLETIVSIYPEWFKDCNMNVAAEGPADNSMCMNLTCSDSDGSAKRENGEALQRTIDKNKESLKVKLMLRRPLNQLVDQGIFPSVKSPPAFHEQRQKLERAKMGDILKHKIQKRPDRQELIQQHILEDSCSDPSKQRQLKRARLSDSLNERLSQRPGPLEFDKVNILHADELLAQAVREGALPFKNTCDTPSPKMRGALDDDSGSDGAFSEHSQGSLLSQEASEPSPNQNQGSPCSAVTSFSMSPPSSVSSPLSVLPSVVSPQSAHEHISDYIVHMHHGGGKEAPNKNRKKTKPKTQPKARTIKFHEYKGPPNAQKNASTSSSALTESSYDLLLQQQQLFLQWQLEWRQKYPQVVLQAAQKPSGDQTGQVNQKTNSISQTQQVFEAPNSPQKLLSKLEDLKVSDLKAELKKRNLPVSGSKPLLIERLKSYSDIPHSVAMPPSSQAPPPSAPSPHTLNVVNVLLDNLSSIPTSVGNDIDIDGCTDTIKDLLGAMTSNSRPSSVVPSETEQVTNGLELGYVSDSSSTSLSNEDIVQLQQRCIEKLQRELERSQKQLQQSIVCQQPALPVLTPSPVGNPKTNVHIPFSDATASTAVPTNVLSSPPSNCDNGDGLSSAESKAAQRQIIHQYLQQKIHHQQLQQRLLQEAQKQQGNSTTTSSPTNSNSTLTALLESRPMNASPVDLNLNAVPKSEPASVLLTQLPDVKPDISDDTFPGVTPIEQINDPQHDLEFPDITPLLVAHATDPMASKASVVSVANGISSRSSPLPSFSALLCKPTPQRSNTDPQFLLSRPPPDYNEATRQLCKVKQNQSAPEDGNPRQSKKQKSSIKSQAVDDVLEILIKNGELPPSAAQEPTTPVTPISGKNEPTSLPLFSSASNGILFSKPMTTTSLLPTTATTSPAGKDIITNNSADLHMASLQSVLDMTPPSSAGFGDMGYAPSSSLDFDLPLDMQDIEAMDLEDLEESHQVSSNSDPTLPIPMGKVSKPPVDFFVHHSVGSSNHLLRASDGSDIHDRVSDRGLDEDLIEWLEKTSTAPSMTNSFQHSSSYGITNDHDPLFSSGHDTLDLFSGDDIDFQPHQDLNFSPWADKADFTT